MSRRARMVTGVIVVAGIAAVIAYLYLTRPVAAPSEDIQDNTEQLQAQDDSGSEVIFRISQEGSRAEYNIEEVLNGADNLVVGTTDEVAGDILVNLSNPAASEVGEIRINARTFETDNGRRDNAVARFVLQSENDANEFITFQPTGISGLPETVSVGNTLEFQIRGDLTISGVTRQATFDVTATLVSEDQLSGRAETTIRREDFELSIPSVPSVASVEESVVLKLDFVANRVTSG